MRDNKPLQIGFIKACRALFFYGYRDGFIRWGSSIICAAVGMACSLGAIFALTFTILNMPDLTISSNSLEYAISYQTIFLVVSTTGLLAYAVLFMVEPQFSLLVDNYSKTNLFGSNQTKRQGNLVRVLACRVKYLVAPYLLMFVCALSVAIWNKQFALLFLILLCVGLLIVQRRENIKTTISLLFSDRALTPIRIGFFRSLVVAIIGVLFISFHSIFNIYSLITMTSALALGVNLIRCWTVYHRLVGLI